MKLRSFKLENVRSFLDQQELMVEGDISILVGPNGGGKTNLLDALMSVFRRHIIPPAYERPVPTVDEPDRYDIGQSDTLSGTPLERHTSGAGKPQKIVIELEVGPSDLENMAKIKEDTDEQLNSTQYRFTSGHRQAAKNLDLGLVAKGDRICITVTDNQVEAESPKDIAFLTYLQAFEFDSIFRRLKGFDSLQTPLLYLPVNRSANDVESQVILANLNAADLKRQTDAMSSRIVAGISNRAIAVIAERFRRLEQLHGSNALSELNKESNIARLTEALRGLGYEWSVKCVNLNNNTYTLELTKQGSTFRIGSASSGERQLLTYLLSIYALDVRDALIVIDEPELHLHPRWQRSLLRLFEKLAADTGNQFVMATHSPTFISPTSVQYVSRVYSENQQSRVVRLNPSGLPDTKHCFDAINSQNNERIFFADLVVLVEGPSDRMVMERLLSARENAAGGGGAIVEVVSVQGKMMFSQYAALLNACGVRSVQVADLDYVQQVGDDSIKSMLALNAKRIKEAIGDPASIDGETIVRMVDDSIAAGKWVGSEAEWNRIKAHRTKLKPLLSEQESSKLKEFIDAKQSEGIYILRRGSLEAYLPEGHSRKDIDRLIKLVSAPDFEERLPSPQKTELLEIADNIEQRRQAIAKGNLP